MKLKRCNLLVIVSLLLFACSRDTKHPEKRTLPVKYSHDRFYVTPVTVSGDTLKFYTDTGGGANMLYEEAAADLNVNDDWIKRGDDSTRVTAMPDFKPQSSIPPPTTAGPFGNKLVITKPPVKTSATGFLGRLWFASRVWEFDYPGRSLSLVNRPDWSDYSSDHRVNLGFQTDSTGSPTTFFPRITIAVDGDSIDVLFDTGAEAMLTKSAAEHFGLGEGEDIGTSFIVASEFNKWKNDHPEWQVIDSADKRTGMPMIKVPRVGIAGYEVGPLWFTKRPDRNFTEYMSQWMDKKIYGAAGGSLFRYFTILVDYPNRVAGFKRSDR